MTVAFIEGLEQFRREQGLKLVATIGTFDGIHLGHQEILKAVCDEAKTAKQPALLITFDPHPKQVISPDSAPKLLTSLEEKRQFIPDFFGGQVLILNFNQQLREMTAERFVADILVERLGVARLVVGYDHALGRNRSGNISELTKLSKKYSLEVRIIGPVLADGQPVSSSRIRQAMQEDRYDEALAMLGHDYAIFGTVERGIGLGHKLGFPTANVAYDSLKQLPPEGIYSCRAVVENKEVRGMMFIGRNHFDPVERISVEANLFDFDQDLYGSKIAVYPGQLLRQNRKFDNTDDLTKQLLIDKKQVEEIFEKEKMDANQQRAKSSNRC